MQRGSAGRTCGSDTTPKADTPRQSQTIRGFNVVSWQASHMRFVLVSDLEKSELEAFSQLLKP